MFHSEKIDQIAAALVKAQGEIVPATKESENPFFKSKYADLGSVWRACSTALHSNGIAVIQGAEPGAGENMKDARNFLSCTLLHSSGQWIKGVFPLVSGKPLDPQSMGAAITYMRRYSLAAMVGITQEDDDGNSAMPRDGSEMAGGAASVAAEQKRRKAQPPAPLNETGQPLVDEIWETTDLSGLEKWQAKSKDEIDKLKEADKKEVRTAYMQKRESFNKKVAA